MAATYRQSIVPSTALTTVTGGPVSGSNGAVTFVNVPVAGQPSTLSRTAVFKMPVARSATASVGINLQSINVSYSVGTSPINSITLALSAISFAPAQTTTAMASTAAGFTLTNGNYTGTFTVNAPAYENGANPEYFQLTITPVVDCTLTTVLTISNIEMVYLYQPTASGSLTNLNVTGWARFGATGTPTNTAAGTISLVDATGTEAANAVTVNGVSGVITTSSLTAAAGTTYLITLTNNKIVGTGSRIYCQLASYAGTFATNGIPVVFTAVATGASTAQIRIGNIHAANALSGVATISFVVFN